MSIAVIIVNYNAGDWLLRSVKSAVQDALVASVYVVDNASSDDSLSTVKSYIAKDLSLQNSTYREKIKLIENRSNLGFGKANNQVLQSLLDSRAESNNVNDGAEYALLLNPDCELSVGVLPAMLPYFEQQADLGMASCVIKNSDGSIQSTCRRNFPTPWTAFLRMTQLQRFGISKKYDFDMGSQPLPKSFVDVEAISGAFMLVRMAAVQEVGLFDEAYFMHCEDLDWCMRFSQQSWRVGFVPEVSVLHEKGVSSKVRKIGVLWNLHQGMLRFFDKFYRNQHSLPLRSVVRVGIYMSFFSRVCVSLLKGIFAK